MLCICILLLPKYIVCCNFCVGIYFFHFNNEETCYFILRDAVPIYKIHIVKTNKKKRKRRHLFLEQNNNPAAAGVGRS